MVWNSWTLDRIVILFVGAGYLLIWIQVTMSHYRQNFHKKAMWAPVLSAPIVSLASILTTLFNSSGWLVLDQILYWVGVISGLIGFSYHFRGVGHRVGGYALRNFLIGPPIIMPLLYAAMSALGLIAIYGG